MRVFNALGEVHCARQVTPQVRPGTVSLPKGLWRRHTANGSTSNALVPDTLTDLGGGACFNDARVQVADGVGDGELRTRDRRCQPPRTPLGCGRPSSD